MWNPIQIHFGRADGHTHRDDHGREHLDDSPERNAGRTEAYPHAKVPDDGRDHDAEQPAGDHSPFTLVPIECVETDVRERHDPNSNNPGRRDADRLEEPRCDRVFFDREPE
ncbi:hypothetical protein [Halorubrum lacusprofundi]|uniref:hypothetical protein n=1 Tax=Halorubrum lacusprofundi TaxID=2247 RepID=UPI00159CB63C|nr:hypothetical protein [Halorubrum lacusprofundi]MCG1008064.1 hypothetical protein [Halorubrum lacusprofundi]